MPFNEEFNNEPNTEEEKVIKEYMLMNLINQVFTRW